MPSKTKKAAFPRDTRLKFEAHPRWCRPVICVLLFAATLAVYGQLRRAPFIRLDDPSYVTENPHVQAGLTRGTITWALTTTDQANWHPLTWLSHALDCQLFGLNPAGPHLVNVLLHGINAVLIFLLLVGATGRTWTSLLIAALFALHPFNVESVAWISERKSVLSMLFFLSALGAYGWYTRRPSLPRYLAVAVLFLLGLASKPMVITLPCVLLLLDFWPLQRISDWGPPSKAFAAPQASLARIAVEKLPLLLLSAVSAVITIVAQHSGQAIASFDLIPLRLRVENAVYSYGVYVWKAFFPTGLAPYYPHPFGTLPTWRVVLVLLSLCAVTVLVWRQHSRHRHLVTGWLWFLGTLVPMIGLVQVGGQAMADRYAYLPLLGIFLMVVWAAGDLGDRLHLTLQARVIASAVLLAAMSFAAWRQIGYWTSTYALWTHTLEVTENNFRAEDNLGVALVELGRYADALVHFQNAAAIYPEDEISHINIAALLARQGDLRDAIVEYEAALRLTSSPQDQTVAYSDLGAIYRQLGDNATARANYLQALHLDPQFMPALTGLGEVEREMMTSKMAEAIIAHPSGEGYAQLGQLLQQSGREAEARSAYEQALKLNPRLTEARKALESLQQKQE
jgi:tetratricopeptide (TPR) repeat protein